MCYDFEMGTEEDYHKIVMLMGGIMVDNLLVSEESRSRSLILLTLLAYLTFS